MTSEGTLSLSRLYRTARAFACGTALSLVSGKEEEKLTSVEERLQRDGK